MHQYFITFYDQIMFCCVGILHFVYLSAKGHLGCFHFLAIINVNIHVQVFHGHLFSIHTERFYLKIFWNLIVSSANIFSGNKLLCRRWLCTMKPYLLKFSFYNVSSNFRSILVGLDFRRWTPILYAFVQVVLLPRKPIPSSPSVSLKSSSQEAGLSSAVWPYLSIL